MIIFYSGSSFTKTYPEKFIDNVAVMSTYYEISKKLHHEDERFKELIERKKENKKK